MNCASLLDTRELDERLERWAGWARSGIPGAVNGSVGYMQERLDQAADSHEMSDEIAVTERAMARTKMEHKVFWRVLAKYYLGRLSFVEISLDFNSAEINVRRLFDRAKSRVGEHINAIDQLQLY